MKVLLSAYACEPGKGSEPEVGLRALLAAAEKHDVWVMTRSNNLPALETFLSGHPLADRVTLVGLDLGRQATAVKSRLGLPGLHWYYDRWQKAAARRAMELDRQVAFDVVHHVTFATYWTRAGVGHVEKPFVWGPVGGGVGVPLGLIPSLGWSGMAEELSRFVVRRAMARMPHIQRTMRRSQVALAQNEETARRITTPGVLRLAPNGAAAGIDRLDPAGGDRRNELVMVGRLVPWKGGVLGVEAFKRLSDPDVRLAILGSGPDMSRIRQRVQALGLQNRVDLPGKRPREEVLERVAGARAVLHPSLHDEASLAVAEALALGRPLVALHRGATPQMARLWPDTPVALIQPSTPGRTAARLTAALEGFLSVRTPSLESPRPPLRRWGDELLSAYETAVASWR